MKIEPSEAMKLWMAALHGVPARAVELERLGLVVEAESLGEAVELRPLLLSAVEDARKGAHD